MPMFEEPVHLVEPDGIVLARNRLAISGAYTRCGLFVRDLPARGARVTCPDCARLEREDEPALQRLVGGR